MAELLACRTAVGVATEMGVRKLALETDSQVVRSKLKTKEKDLSIFSPLVEEVKGLLLTIEE